MPDGYSYPAEIQRDEDGRYVVAFPDFGWGATDGATLEEALAEARDLLRELITTTIREGGTLPEPSPAGEQHSVVVPSVQTARKAASHAAELTAEFFTARASQADIEATRRLLRRSGGQPPDPEDRLDYLPAGDSSAER